MINPTYHRLIARAGGVLALFLLALAAAACRPAASGATAVKLVIDADGVYQVSAGALQAAGFDLVTARPEALQLSSGGEPVGFTLVGEGKNRAVRFYGQALGPQAYTAQNIYWLSREATPAAAVVLAARPAAPAGSAVSAVMTATVRAEEQRLYYGQAGAGEDRWVWQALSAPAETTIPLAVPDPAGGSGVLRVQVIGNSTAQTTPNHHLVLSLNGAQIAEDAWGGMGTHVITATTPAGLRPGENRVLLAAPGDTGAPADSVLLDWVELSYPRELALTGSELTFSGAAAGYSFRTNQALAALWDITDAARPIALTDYTAADGVVRLAGDGTARRFIAVTQAGLRTPAAITAVDPASDLRAWPGGADMIVVTVPQFREALKPLVAAREAQGIRVAVVDVTQVYDSFSAGRAGPEAIRALVQHATAHWTPPAPRFLLLAGDASYDPRGYLKGSEIDLVPTQLVMTHFSGWTASDVWYALPGAGDSVAGGPLLAVGRFPAQTADQLATMVAKTLQYERGDRSAKWRQRAFLAADDDEPGFAAEATAFAAGLTGYSTRTITLADDGSQTRTDLREAFETGTGFIGYFGHGSVTLWAQEKILSVEDVAGLSNREQWPIIFAVTCLTGLFEHPNTSSLGEALLRAKNGGAVAGLVPSSAALLPDQSLLAQALAASLAAQPTLGEAVLQAQASLADSTGGLREILLTFNLLGDPALTLR